MTGPHGRKPKRVAPPRQLAEASMSSLLDLVLAQRGLQPAIDAQRILMLWGEVVGPRIAARTSADRIGEGVLHVSVASAAWMQELTMLLPGLQQKLRDAIGPTAKELKIRLSLGATSKTATVVDPRAADLRKPRR